jgi:HD-GYP domain-containing protein (c-di-GMP phosphodiesterase class II)
VGAETEEGYFRETDISFLEEGGEESFDIFYQTESFGNIKYIKVASIDPKHQDKVRRLLEDRTDQDFYIQEEDLFNYYKYTTKSLKVLVSNPDIPHKEKTEKIYEVFKGVMKEFFENNTSEKILEDLEELMDMMEDCMTTAEAGFHGIAAITSKDYTYTHSVNVGLYCMTFGVKSKRIKNDTRQLSLGGMLLDVDKSLQR